MERRSEYVDGRHDFVPSWADGLGFADGKKTETCFDWHIPSWWFVSPFSILSYLCLKNMKTLILQQRLHCIRFPNHRIQSL